MSSFKVVFASVVLAAVLPAPARADDTGTLPGGAMLTWPRVKLATGDNGDLEEPPDSETFRQHLNLASCQCSQAAKTGGTTVDTDLYFELQLVGTTGVHPTAEKWVGTSCQTDATTRTLQCLKVGDIGDLDALAVMFVDEPYSLFDLINNSMDLQTMPCRLANNGDAFAWVNSDTDKNGELDFFSSRPIDLMKFTDVVGFDTQPPPLPDSLRADGSEASIDVSWKNPVGNANDYFAFQAFCMDANGNPVGDHAGERLYTTTREACDITPTDTDFTFTPIDLTSMDGTPVADAPEPFKLLDPAYLCHTEKSSTAESMTIKGLTNGEEYTIGFVAVDFYGNATPAFFTRTVVPKPVTDFWEDVHDRGDNIEGGFFCSSNNPSGAVTIVLVLGLAALLRRRRSISPGAICALLLAPAVARADDWQPYWEDPARTDTEGGGVGDETPKWNAGIKIGPYVPNIDKQVGKNAKSGMGPYQAMFGNYWTVGDCMPDCLKPHDTHVYQILPEIDVDRFIWTGSGQLGIGGSLGYMQKTAYTYLDVYPNGPAIGTPTTADDPRRPRSTSENTFRLIPLALTVTYRASQLDDRYGIPIVPYLRGGLSYYVWWLKGPTGDTSFVCKDGSMDSGCARNKAYGGTLGFQGSIGLAIRAERIDREAARSMVQSGIYHAGFYAELQAAVVNGFGDSHKLSVGDRTWFAGANFEF